MNYNELLGKEWANLLAAYLETGNLQKVAGILSRLRKTNTILPPEGSDMFFRVFKLVQPSDIKVIICGQDPYPYINPVVMTGIAFECSSTSISQPSLINIFKEIDREYPEFVTKYRKDFTYLTKQGVFLVNTALSVEVNKPGSHSKIWEQFTIAWIKQLQQLNDKVWLLWGRNAQEYKNLITNPSHAIIETSHPSPLGALKEAPIAFMGSNCFKQANEELEARNRKLIEW